MEGHLDYRHRSQRSARPGDRGAAARTHSGRADRSERPRPGKGARAGGAGRPGPAGGFRRRREPGPRLRGASQVLIVSSGTTGGTSVGQDRTATDAAKAAGAGRIVYTSHMGANPSSPFPPMADHAATEAALRESGVAFTSLRNGFYATTTLWLLGAALQTGELVALEDGPVSWTAHADLAQAAAIALTQENLDGITPALTGSEAIDMAGAAAIAAELTGRRIRRGVVPESEYRAGLIARGLPEPAVDMQMGLFAASRLGDFAEVDPTLARLIGRPPTSLRDVLAAAGPARRHRPAGSGRRSGPIPPRGRLGSRGRRGSLRGLGRPGWRTGASSRS